VRAPASAAPLTSAGGTRAALLTVGLAVAFALAAAGIFVPAAKRPAVLIAAVAAAFVWVAGERFGSLFSGSATDPNSGPLLLLVAAAFWPRRRR
jgi:MYXO-CTERM domain-containing protein